MPSLSDELDLFQMQAGLVHESDAMDRIRARARQAEPDDMISTQIAQEHAWTVFQGAYGEYSERDAARVIEEMRSEGESLEPTTKREAERLAHSVGQRLARGY
jgi:hypothetical protein